MPIPDVPPGKLYEAMQTFDDRYRNSEEWQNWHQNRSHKFAIRYNGNQYPVKMIISLATKMARSDFSGGMQPGQAGWYAAQHGLDVVQLRPQS